MDSTLQRYFVLLLDGFRNFLHFLSSEDPLAGICLMTIAVMAVAMAVYTWTHKKEWLLVVASAGLYMIPVVMRGMHIM